MKLWGFFYFYRLSVSYSIVDRLPFYCLLLLQIKFNRKHIITFVGMWSFSKIRQSLAIKIYCIFLCSFLFCIKLNSSCISGPWGSRCILFEAIWEPSSSHIRSRAGLCCCGKAPFIPNTCRQNLRSCGGFFGHLLFIRFRLPATARVWAGYAADLSIRR